MKKIAVIILVLLPLLGFAQDKKKILLVSGFEVCEFQDTDSMRFIFLLPADIKGKQKVLETHFSYQPEKVFEEDGIKYAEFKFSPRDMYKTKVTITVIMDIYRCNLKTIKKGGATIQSSPAELEPYLIDEQFIEKDDPFIQEIAAKLKGKSTEKTAQNIYKYVSGKILYKNKETDFSAKYALTYERGMCKAFSTSFVALCRALSIPARRVYGYTNDIERPGKHSWAEYYDENWGWIPVDPTIGKKLALGSLENKYIYLSHKLHDERMDYAEFYRYWYKFSGEKPEVKEFYSLREFL